MMDIPKPELQIDFSFALGQIRSLYLQEALANTIEKMEIADIDSQLAEYVSGDYLKALAKHGLRGELVFPVPCVLEENPYILGYYRLLLGFSQKEFYTKEFGVSGFKSMEVRGVLTPKNKESLAELCAALVASAQGLIDGIGSDRVSKQLLDDLTILTVGPQLRGGNNNKKGSLAIVTVFQSIHNRVGEAEKSHQKAKAEGYVECWTVVNVDKIDIDTAFRESPTTNKFFRISAIESGSGDDFEEFKSLIISLAGIKSQ